MNDHSEALHTNAALLSKEPSQSPWTNGLGLLLWLTAAAVAFLPFALNTSPWNAITLHVPGHQGNWWHFLAGAPFFLAFPMIWLRLRALFAAQPSVTLERRVIWSAAAFSMLGTTLVEVPFLLHLAGTSAWQRLAVLSLGFGIMVASTILLFLRRRRISPTRSCLVAIDTAYLANAALCVVVYSGVPGTLWSKSGWLLSMVLVWPIVFELIALFASSGAAYSFSSQEAN